jgi:quercetin dioxygenase-like cupin family protein
MSQITTWDEFPAYPYVPGVLRQAVCGEKVMMTKITYQGQVTIPLHRHEAEQIMLVVQGRLWATVGNEEKEIGPGALLIINTNVMHAFRKLSEEDVVFHECFAPIRMEYLIGYKGPDPAGAMIMQGLAGAADGS